MNRFKLLTNFSALGLLLLTAVKALAWTHALMSDTDLVQKSDLIVIAHVKPGSIVFIPQEGGSSWRHTAVLVISEVIKGKNASTELPVVFRYGMDPLVIGKDGNIRGVSRGISDPNSQIVMGYQGGEYGTIPGDLAKDHIWFLRFPPAPIHPTDKPADQNVLGVSEPEELQPVELKSYFEAFLALNPEDILKNYASGNSTLAIRSKTYLNHLAIAQILKEPDVQKRAQLLLPYFLFTDDKDRPPDQGEAALQLWESCGQTGAAMLLPYFDNPKYRAMRSDIMSLWANAQYHGGIPLLVDLLTKETTYWQNQTPDQRDLWVDVRPGHSPTMDQITSMRRIEMILFVFRQVPDANAKAAIAKLSPIWKKMFPGDSSRGLGQELNQGLMIPGV